MKTYKTFLVFLCLLATCWPCVAGALRGPSGRGPGAATGKRSVRTIFEPRWTSKIEIENCIRAKFKNGGGDKLQLIDATGHLVPNSGDIGLLKVSPNPQSRHTDERFYIAYIWGEPLCAMSASLSHADKVTVRVEALPPKLRQSLRRLLALVSCQVERGRRAPAEVTETIECLQKSIRPVLAQASARGRGDKSSEWALVTTAVGSSCEVCATATRASAAPYRTQCQFSFRDRARRGRTILK